MPGSEELTELKDSIGREAYQLEQKLEDLNKQIKSFREDATAKLEQAKQNEILRSLVRLDTRLTAIEARLPPEEES